MKTNEKLAVLNTVKEEFLNKTFRMARLKEAARSLGFKGNNSFWQIFKDKLLEKQTEVTYRFKNADPINLDQLASIKEEINRRYAPKENEEQAAIKLLKSKGYKIIKVTILEEEV